MEVTQADMFLAASPFPEVSAVQIALLCAAVLALGWVIVRARRASSSPSAPRRAAADNRTAPARRPDLAARDVEEVMAELDALAHEVHRGLDVRLAKLEAVNRDADARIDQLSRLLRQSHGESVLDLTVGDAIMRQPTPEGALMPPEPERAASDPAAPMHADVHGLADQGLSYLQIAEKLGRTTGEIELILALRKTRAQVQRAMTSRGL